MSRRTTLAERYRDRRVRALRDLGFTVDDGMPDRGTRYGGARTIHNTGTIDVVIQDGQVTEVWFRCMQLAARVSIRDTESSWVTTDAYEVPGSPLVAVELAPQPPAIT